MPTARRGVARDHRGAGCVVALRPARHVVQLELGPRQGRVGGGDTGREGVDRSPARPDAAQRRDPPAGHLGPPRARVDTRVGGGPSARPGGDGGDDVGVQLLEPGLPGAQAPRDIEPSGALGQQGVVPDAAGNHGVGHAHEHHPVEVQAPGPGEGSHEDAVAETAVGSVRGVEARLFEHGPHGAPEGVVVGATRHGVELTQRQHHPAHLGRSGRLVRRPRPRVGTEVAVEQSHRPRRVRPPRAFRCHRLAHEVLHE